MRNVLPVILGILLSIGGLIGVSQTGITEGEIYECKAVVSMQKRAEEAMKAYEAAKGTSQEQALLKKAKQASDEELLYRSRCSEAKSYYRSWFIIFLSVSGFGFLLLTGGLLVFFVGRKKTA